MPLPVPPTETNDPLGAFLSTRDVPCPGCGYNLRGLRTDHCPECHRHLVLSVSLAEPPIALLVLAIVGLAACGAAFGLGLCAVLLISVLDNGFPRGYEAVMLLWVPAAIVAVDGAAVALSLRPACRRWFRARSRSGRLLVVLGCWGISVAAAGLWLSLFLRFL